MVGNLSETNLSGEELMDVRVEKLEQPGPLGITDGHGKQDQWRNLAHRQILVIGPEEEAAATIGLALDVHHIHCNAEEFRRAPRHRHCQPFILAGPWSIGA